MFDPTSVVCHLHGYQEQHNYTAVRDMAPDACHSPSFPNVPHSFDDRKPVCLTQRVREHAHCRVIVLCDSEGHASHEARYVVIYACSKSNE